MSRHVIEIPRWHPPTANQWVGRHWAVKAKLRAQTTEWIAVYAARLGATKATGRRRVSLLLTGWARGGKFPDRDAFDKLLLDALVQSGMLTDDDTAGLEGRMAVEFERGPKRTVITLEDVQP